MVIGGETIHPGDIMCGDDDGVVVVRPNEAAEVAAASQAREEKEAQLMKSLEQGVDLLSAVGMDRIAAGKGCTFDD